MYCIAVSALRMDRIDPVIGTDALPLDDRIIDHMGAI